MVDDTPDPTAGRRARLIREQPDIPLPVTDPTDPRYGPVEPSASEPDIGDPTDPRFGEPA